MADLKEVGKQVAQQVQGGAQQAQALTRQAAPGLELLARVGYASKGVVYGALGALALSVALGRGGATTDTQGTLLRLEDLPGGGPLLWLLAVGLLGYALWQAVRAALDPEHHGAGPGALLKRGGYLLSAALNLGLAAFAARLASGAATRRNQDSEADAAQQVLNLPGGQVLLFLGGAALLGVAANQLYSAYGAKFMKRMAFTDVGARFQPTLTRIGQVGIASRGLLMAIMGAFLLVAAWRNQAGVAVGVSEALTWLRAQPAGNLLLGAVALGTLCYGVWCVVQARYRRIRVAG